MSEAKTDSSTRLLILGLGAALVTAGLFAGLWTAERANTPQEIDRALGEEAPAVRDTAVEVVELLINVDADSIEETGERVLALSTGNFREDYEEVLPSLGPAFEEAGATTEGAIVEGPDISFSGSNEAFAVAKVVQTSEVHGTERTSGFTIRLALLRDGARWRADRFEILGEL